MRLSLATVVIGVLITSTFLTLLVLPIIYYWIDKKKAKVQKYLFLGASFFKHQCLIIIIIDIELIVEFNAKFARSLIVIFYI
jgi:hypothetical protein